jgi:hypothetical protein
MLNASESRVLSFLEARFENEAHRHNGIAWSDVEKRIASSKDALKALAEMERTGGEPDVVGSDAATGKVIFCDCSAESPAGRRSLCYDGEALESRKEHKPSGSAVGTAASMGVELLTEARYRELQELGAGLPRPSAGLVVRGLGKAHALPLLSV